MANGIYYGWGGGLGVGAAFYVLSLAGLLFLPVMSPSINGGTNQTGKSLGWINMIGQLAGAIALSASGYVGMGFSSDSKAPLSEYTGIWYLAIGCCVVGAGCAWVASVLSSRCTT